MKYYRAINVEQTEEATLDTSNDYVRVVIPVNMSVVEPGMPNIPILANIVVDYYDKDEEPEGNVTHEDLREFGIECAKELLDQLKKTGGKKNDK